MQRFQHILMVIHGAKDDLSCAKQAIILANQNKAHLNILLMCEEFPAILDPYKGAYQQSLIDDFNIKIMAIQQALGLTEHTHKLEIQFEGSSPKATQIVERVLQGHYDLLIKTAESNAKNAGFKALDMDLLRKCPCPVWLHRPTNNTLTDTKFAVAIDPESDEASGRALAIKLLKMADSLAIKSQHELAIMSCWDYPLENTLRHSPFINVPEDHIQNMVRETNASHNKSLDTILKKVHLKSEHTIYHQRGVPDHLIPELITQLKIDVLVMGTVGRTGIPGFIIGNTAENVLQKISCSLLALKPDGYVSPVKV